MGRGRSKKAWEWLTRADLVGGGMAVLVRRKKPHVEAAVWICWMTDLAVGEEGGEEV